MGNCSTRPAVREDSTRIDYTNHKGHRPRRSSLGRLAELLSLAQQSSTVRDAVSEKLPTAANRGSQEVLQLVEEPGFFDISNWTSGLDVPTIKARATSLEKAIDTLLNPVLDDLESLLAGKAAALGVTEPCHWHNAGLKELQLLLPLAANAKGVGLPTLSRAVSSMTEVTLAVRDAAVELPAPPEVFQVGSLNRLMGIIGALITRQVVAERPEDGKAEWEEFGAIQRAMGLHEDRLAVTLAGPAKNLMLWMLARASGISTFTFKVRRSHAIEDAFCQVKACEWLQTRQGSMLISPRFMDEASDEPSALEPGEGHGPRKEFFLLAGQGMLQQPQGTGSLEMEVVAQPAQPLFLYYSWSACYWFNTTLKESTELRAKYKFAGWLLGQSFANRASLGAAFPAVLFEKLLKGGNFQATVETLQEFDPETAAKVRATSLLREHDWQQLLLQEGLPPTFKRKAYIVHAAHGLLVTDVLWQFTAFHEGFYQAVDYSLMLRWCRTPTGLEEMACGSATQPLADLSIQEVFRVVLDPHMQQKSPLLGPAVLQVVDAWPLKTKLRFIRFVTGATRPPQPRMELLRVAMPFSAQDKSQLPHLLRRLPQAHTCENILELPDYWAALLHSRGVLDPCTLSAKEQACLTAELVELLNDRLTWAIMHCTTYELTGGPSQALLDLRDTAPAARDEAASLDDQQNSDEADASAQAQFTPDRTRPDELLSHDVDVTPSPQVEAGGRAANGFAGSTGNSRVAGELSRLNLMGPDLDSSSKQGPICDSSARFKVHAYAAKPKSSLDSPGPSDSIPAVRGLLGEARRKGSRLADWVKAGPSR